MSSYVATSCNGAAGDGLGQRTRGRSKWYELEPSCQWDHHHLPSLGHTSLLAGKKIASNRVTDLIVLRVGNLLRLPFALVGRVGNPTRPPLPLVVWVVDHGWLPLAVHLSGTEGIASGGFDVSVYRIGFFDVLLYHANFRYSYERWRGVDVAIERVKGSSRFKFEERAWNGN